MIKHTPYTPGPWRIYENPRTENIHVFGGGDHICVMGASDIIDAANARLIRAAPEMLALLKELEWDFGTGRTYVSGEYYKIKHLINKIEGKDDD